MKAIRVHEFGPPAVMKLEDVPDPQPGARSNLSLPSKRPASIPSIPTFVPERMQKSRRCPTLRDSTPRALWNPSDRRSARFKTGDRVYINHNISGAYAQKTLCARGIRLCAAGSFELRAGCRCLDSLCHRALCPLRSCESASREKPCSFTVPAEAWAALPCRLPERWECGLSEPQAPTRV